jgi:predicted 3-demethylubiquinone-9 3-methyltransferase (glyoxalase superfamily)
MKASAVTLWFGDEINEAAAWYLDSLPGTTCDAEFDKNLKGNPGQTITLVLPGGLHLTLLNGGSLMEKNHSVSIVLTCRDQEEIDQIWDSLTAEGGKPGQCGWLVDRFGFHWQVIPEQMHGLMSGPNVTKVVAAMLTMGKLDIGQLRAAAENVDT